MLARNLHKTLTKHTLAVYGTFFLPVIGGVFALGLLLVSAARRDREGIGRGLTLGAIALAIAVIDAIVMQYGSGVTEQLAINLGGVLILFIVVRHILKGADLYEETKEGMRLFGGKRAEAPEENTQEYEPAPEGEVRCRECGETNDEMATFCQRCAERL